MTTFTIDTDNIITAFAEYDGTLNTNGSALEGVFASEKDLAKLSAAWSIGRYVEVWNAFAGVVPFAELKPVKKFTDRKTATARIWKAIQALTPTPAKPAAPSATKKAKTAKRATPKGDAPKGKKEAIAEREGSKKSIVLGMLRRPAGATLAEIMSATDWQAHSVRGFISGALGKKMGLKVDSSKSESGDRIYKLA